VKNEDRDVARHELIGLLVTVESRHAGWNGLEGTVVDETKHTLIVERALGSEAVVPKSGQRFVFRVGAERFAISPGAERRALSTTAVVEGDEILFKPEDRTKKVRG